ncbi:MAG: hypothetical protein KKG04_08015, partial [Candidatus Thermoplasmatota archaeon]|nr:hypothetical protein [Candidatus Thermoplasmatota archaeon]
MIIVHQLSSLFTILLKKGWLLRHLMERLTISLDKESTSIINAHLSRYNGSKADVIRKALHYLKEIEQLETKTPIETIRIYI